jgi:hypothetical protein
MTKCLHQPRADHIAPRLTGQQEDPPWHLTFAPSTGRRGHRRLRGADALWVSMRWIVGTVSASVLAPQCVGRAAATGERERPLAGARYRMPGDRDMSSDPHAGTEPCVPPRNAQRTGNRSCTELGQLLDRHIRVNLGHEAGGSMILALITASAAVLPSTAA